MIDAYIKLMRVLALSALDAPEPSRIQSRFEPESVIAIVDDIALNVAGGR